VGHDRDLPNAERPSGSFVATREHRRFAEFCESCRRYGWIGVCAGDAGVGKTASSRAYAHWDAIEPYLASYLSFSDDHDELLGCRTVVYTASQNDGPRAVATRIAQLRLALSYLIADAQVSAEEPRRALIAPPDRTRLIVVDEADQLKVPALEELRNIYDDARGRVGLVLNGLPDFRRRLTRYPKLYSRTGFAHDFRPLRADETTEMILDHAAALRTELRREDFPDPDGVARIVRATRGNFRLLERLLGQIERILRLTRADPRNAGKEVVVSPTLVDLAINRLILGTE
jgi:DNA transposition AAA+ family ATPase